MDLNIIRLEGDSKTSRKSQNKYTVQIHKPNIPTPLSEFKSKLPLYFKNTEWKCIFIYLFYL